MIQLSETEYAVGAYRIKLTYIKQVYWAGYNIGDDGWHAEITDTRIPGKAESTGYWNREEAVATSEKICLARCAEEGSNPEILETFHSWLTV